MSRAPRDAYHAARLLQNELARIALKRERQIGKANSDFQLELIQAVSGAAPSALQLVRQVLREDASQMHLASALSTLLADGRPTPPAALEDERSERETEPPIALTAARVLSRVEHAGIGAGGGDDEPIDAEFEEVSDSGPGVDDDGYRYPEPGEPAIELPDGRVVADPSGALA